MKNPRILEFVRMRVKKPKCLQEAPEGMRSTLNNELSEMVRINVQQIWFERSSRCGIWPDGRGLGVVDFHMGSSK